MLHCSCVDENYSGQRQVSSVRDSTINNELFSGESITTNCLFKMSELSRSVDVQLMAALT